MYVKQLQEGMLLTATPGNKLLLQEDVVHYRGTHEDDYVTVCIPIFDRYDEGHEGVLTGPVIYLGWNQDRFHWDGVYKHHRVLAGDTIALVSGYHFKNFKPVLR